MSLDSVYRVADQFSFGQILSIDSFAEKGNINPEAYVVATPTRRYLLQRINTDVFTLPDRVTESVRRWTRQQASSLQHADWAAPYEAVELVATRDGDYAFSEPGGYWRAMTLIEDVVCHRSLAEALHRADQLRLAEETGRGLAVSTRLAHGISAVDLPPSLLGYRDTAGYLAQFDSVMGGGLDNQMPTDSELRVATGSLYHLAIDRTEWQRRRDQSVALALISQVDSQREFAMGLQRAVQSGELKRTVIHGDTKLENFLFCRKSGRVKSLVDLDTVMAYTWLADWGDLARSLVNVAGEWEPNPENIQVDAEVYEALMRGFHSVEGVAPESEQEWMPRAVFTIAFELGVRFLTDYLRGDNYFRTHVPDGNLVRARVQLTLANRLAEYHQLSLD